MYWCGICSEKLKDSAFRTYQDHCREAHPEMYATVDWKQAYMDEDSFWEFKA